MDIQIQPRPNIPKGRVKWNPEHGKWQCSAPILDSQLSMLFFGDTSLDVIDEYIRYFHRPLFAGAKPISMIKVEV